MFEYLLLDANTPFTISLCFMFGLAFLEILGLLTGLSMMSWLDELSPFDLDIDADASGITSWLCLSKLPLLVWLLLFSCLFSLSGLSINYFTIAINNHSLSTLFSLPIALTCTLLLLPIAARPISRIMPNVQTDALSMNSYAGITATITLDGCAVGRPVEAILTDAKGTQQQVLVEPGTEDYEFHRDDIVMLVEKTEQGIWLAVPYSVK